MHSVCTIYIYILIYILVYILACLVLACCVCSAVVIAMFGDLYLALVCCLFIRYADRCVLRSILSAVIAAMCGCKLVYIFAFICLSL